MKISMNEEILGEGNMYLAARKELVGFTPIESPV